MLNPIERMGRLAQSVQRLATGWTVWGSNPGGGEIFRTCPDRPWGPPSLLYNGYRVFLGGKERPGRDADPSPPSSAIGHERVELYLYSPYGPYGLYRASVPVQGCTSHIERIRKVCALRSDCSNCINFTTQRLQRPESISFCFHIMVCYFLLEMLFAVSVGLIGLTQPFLGCSFYSFVIRILVRTNCILQCTSHVQVQFVCLACVSITRKFLCSLPLVFRLTCSSHLVREADL